MNILNILHVPGKAGTEHAFVSMSLAIKNNGHNITCMIPKNSLSKKQIIAHNLPIIENNKTYKNFGKFDLIFISTLRKIIKNNKIDAVISNNGRITEIAKKATKKLCPLISINHGTNIKKTALADFAIVINNTQYGEIISAGFNKDRAYIIPNSIPLNTNINLKPENNQPKSILTIGFLGRLSQEKGPDILIKAANLLHKQNIKFKVNIAGDGNMLNELKTLVEQFELTEIINFVGWVENKEKFFKDIDIFCLPSRQEAFGIVLLEAMEHMIPIVASDCDGPKDIFEDNYEALICKKDDVQDLSDKLITLINNTELREKLRTNAKDKLIKNYTEQIVSKKLEDMLQKVLYLSQRLM